MHPARKGYRRADRLEKRADRLVIPRSGSGGQQRRHQAAEPLFSPRIRHIAPGNKRADRRRPARLVFPSQEDQAIRELLLRDRKSVV